MIRKAHWGGSRRGWPRPATEPREFGRAVPPEASPRRRTGGLHSTSRQGPFERSDDVGIAQLPRQPQRRFAGLAARTRVGAGAEKQLHHFRVTEIDVGRVVQRGVPVAVGGVDLGAGFDQEACDVDPAADSGQLAAAAEMNWFLPGGKPLWKYGGLDGAGETMRVETSDCPSSFWVSSRKRSTRRQAGWETGIPPAWCRAARTWRLGRERQQEQTGSPHQDPLPANIHGAPQCRQSSRRPRRARRSPEAVAQVSSSSPVFRGDDRASAGRTSESPQLVHQVGIALELRKLGELCFGVDPIESVLSLAHDDRASVADVGFAAGKQLHDDQILRRTQTEADARQKLDQPGPVDHKLLVGESCQGNIDADSARAAQ